MIITLEIANNTITPLG